MSQNVYRTLKVMVILQGDPYLKTWKSASDIVLFLCNWNHKNDLIECGFYVSIFMAIR